jgi:hypothetical protein
MGTLFENDGTPTTESVQRSFQRWLVVVANPHHKSGVRTVAGSMRFLNNFCAGCGFLEISQLGAFPFRSSSAESEMARCEKAGESGDID